MLMSHRGLERSVLNVGGHDRSIALPPPYAGWRHVLLDIDPKGRPDVVCDARRLTELPGAEYDAVYCSHNLEHYYRHDVARVLAGFHHVLKADGVAHIRVPDMGALMRTVVEKNLDIDDFLYESPAGPITVRDVIYGYGVEIEASGEDFYAHKTGFTQKSLLTVLDRAGFHSCFVSAQALEIQTLAFKAPPNEYFVRLFELAGPP